jgi:hypothetical protein
MMMMSMMISVTLSYILLLSDLHLHECDEISYSITYSPFRTRRLASVSDTISHYQRLSVTLRYSPFRTRRLAAFSGSNRPSFFEYFWSRYPRYSTTSAATSTKQEISSGQSSSSPDNGR